MKTLLLLMACVLCGCRRELLVDSSHDQNMSNVTAMRKEISELSTFEKEKAMFEWLIESNRQFFLPPDLKVQETQRFTPYSVLQREDGEIAVADGRGKRMDLVTGSNRIESAIIFANYISNRDNGTLPPPKSWKEIGKP